MRSFPHAMLAVFLAASGLAAPAAARDLDFTVPAGKRSLISSHALYSSDSCTFSTIPTAKVVTPPHSGKIDIVEEKRIVNAGNCGKIEGWARNVYYTPAPGFRGSDFVRVDFQHDRFSEVPSPVSSTDNISLTVK